MAIDGHNMNESFKEILHIVFPTLAGMIGKKHVGPKYVYKFDFERDSDTLNMLQCARNITQMKLYVREFFAQQNNTT